MTWECKMQARRGHDTILPEYLHKMATTATGAKYYCDIDAEAITCYCLQEMHKHSLAIVEVLIKEKPRSGKTRSEYPPVTINFARFEKAAWITTEERYFSF